MLCSVGSADSAHLSSFSIRSRTARRRQTGETQKRREGESPKATACSPLPPLLRSCRQLGYVGSSPFPSSVRRAAVSSHLRRDPQATGNQQDGRGRWWPGACLECIGELSVTLQRVRVRHRRPSFFLHGWVSLPRWSSAPARRLKDTQPTDRGTVGRLGAATDGGQTASHFPPKNM